jgi:hypothetical protein
MQTELVVTSSLAHANTPDTLSPPIIEEKVDSPPEIEEKVVSLPEVSSTDDKQIEPKSPTEVEPDETNEAQITPRKSEQLPPTSPQANLPVSEVPTTENIQQPELSVPTISTATPNPKPSYAAPAPTAASLTPAPTAASLTPTKSTHVPQRLPLNPTKEHLPTAAQTTSPSTLEKPANATQVPLVVTGFVSLSYPWSHIFSTASNNKKEINVA